jgi:hypothetical protein
MKLTSSFAVAFAFCISTTNLAAANLIAHWGFDEGEGDTAFDQVGGFHGTLEGDAVMLESGGISGGSVDVGVTGFVNAGATLEFIGTEKFSIQVWLKTSTADTTLISRHNMGFLNGYGLGIGANGAFYVYQSNNPSLDTGAPGLHDGQWHQVVMVRDSYRNEVRLYVDGQQAPLPDSTEVLSPLVATTAPFLIGGVTNSGVPINRYRGLLDEVRVWDDALSDAEVAFLHAFPASMNTLRCGDYNRDESVSASDALGTLRVAVGLLDGLDCIVDTNGSDDITSSDALLILRDSVGQNVPFHCPLCVASDLEELRVEAPCTNGGSPICTASTTASEPVTMGGEAGAVYDVTLRIRGVVEQKTYTGGTQDGFFYAGGTPAADGYNVVKLEVSEPAATYYLNAGTSGIERVWELDATEKIPVAAGATVVVTSEPGDGLQIANTDGTGQPIIPPGIPPAPEAFPGQFVHVEVIATDKQE